MPVDSREPSRNYPIPNVANDISEEFPRLITAITAIGTDVAGLLTSVSQRALLVHSHSISDVTGLSAALAGKQDITWRPALGELTDVVTTGASAGQVLRRGASGWQPSTLTNADIGSFPAASVSTFGASLIDDADAAAARGTLGLGSSALTSDDRVAYGDANASIAANARVVAINAALTTARTLTLPAANAAGAPPYIIVVDEARGVSATNTLTIQRAGSDTINGTALPIVLNTAGAAVILTRNGTNAWTAISTGGGGTAMATYRYVATASQTVVSGADALGAVLSYVPNGVVVSVNGSVIAPNLYTASNGSSITFTTALVAGDIVVIHALGAFSVADTWTKAEADARYYTQTASDARFIRQDYRNRIINGAMQISQERGAASVDVTTLSLYTIDQWQATLSITPGGTLRVQQIASVTPGGSPSRLRHTVQVADASIAAGDFYGVGQPIEGLMIADAMFGTAAARQVILRFGVRSSVAGTFGVRLTNSASNRSWVGTITIAAGQVNTDLVRALVIPGDTTGTWLTDTGIGLSVQITLAAGTTFHGSPGWQAGNLSTTSAQTNFMGTAGATFDLFDVGLYVDPLNVGAAPPWEMPAVDDGLRSSQRYYSRQLAVARFNAPAAGAVMETPVYWPVLTRVAPVISGPVGASTTNVSSSGVASATLQGCRFFIVAAAAGDALSNGGIVTADARF